jgi:Sjoegren syndrome nuclear autoantigen 1
MASQGATLQNTNVELVKCIEELREKREEVNRQILKDQEERAKVQNDIRILTERLNRVNDALARKEATRDEYDRTIKETEGAYLKIIESTNTLLTVLKRESTSLTKKKQSSH